MIQNFQAAHGGVVFYRTPGARSRARRMRLTALLVVAAIGFSSGVLLQFHQTANLNDRLGEAQPPLPTGPLAYFPS